VTNATLTHRPTLPQATHLRLGRLLLLALLGVGVLGGSVLWVLQTKARPLVQAVTDSGAWPPWLKQTPTYAAPETKAALTPPAPEPDKTAAELAKLRTMLQQQQNELEELKRRGMVKPTPMVHPQAPPVKREPPPMLYVSHEVKDAPAVPKAPEYTLAPGATKLPCVIETAINSDVEGYFTAKVSTNVYDTATGRHLLVPQGSTILGHDQSSTLLYGNERLPTISLTLALPDGRSVDLGHAPVTDQQGIAGLTGKVDQHFWRLFGAVFVGGALRGGTQALQVGLAQGGPVGQVAGGIGATGSQVTQQRLGRALDTRPTITVESGQLCQVLLTKPLTLAALWQ
jgi:hypothetical protein